MTLSKFAQNAFVEYEKWVRFHPRALSEVEYILRLLPLFFTNRYESSLLYSELIYGLSNLLVFFNDQIIFNSIPAAATSNLYKDKFEKWLTIIEYCEVFFELSAQRAWGSHGRWLIIFIVQLLKSLIRLYLLFCKGKQIVEACPIQFLDRKNLHRYSVNSQSVPESVTLKTGRLIRTIEGAPSLENRNWTSSSKTCKYASNDKILDQRQINAEVLYICKPLLHLSSMYYFGTHSWKPWMLALLVDISSLYTLSHEKLNNLKKFSQRQEKELTRRRRMLLLYLLRSPFYEYKTKELIMTTWRAISRVPFMETLFQPFMDYLPLRQQIYFYLWSL